MSRVTYNIVHQPQGDLYRRLIETALRRCTGFLVVVRKTVTLAVSARRTLKELDPFLEGTSEQAEWPGTQLTDGRAAVSRYRLNRDSAVVLSQAANGLYGWLQPELPEDLCLLRADGTPWLVTISHERDAFLVLASDEFDALRSALPDLQLHPSRSN